jgi:hypothetical protein
MNIGSDPQKSHFLFAPCVRVKGRNARAQQTAERQSLSRFGVRRPRPGEHPTIPDSGVLTFHDW